MQEEKGDDARHQKIGPGAARPADQYGRDDDGDIRDRIVSAEQSDGPHIGIAVPKSRENQLPAHVHGQVASADYAHDFLFGWLCFYVLRTVNGYHALPSGKQQKTRSESLRGGLSGGFFWRRC